MPDVSIIIVSWNTRELLLKCLQSVEEDTRGLDTETIVVDNASSDGSADAVARRFPRVTIIRNTTNLGFARANNLGITAARGRYLCMINSDIVLLRGCIEKLTAFMDQHPTIALAGPQILNGDGTPQATCTRLPTVSGYVAHALAFHKLFPKLPLFWDTCSAPRRDTSGARVEAIKGCFWIVRRDAVNRVGALDEDFFIYCEDIDWCRRFRQAGWNVAFYPGSRAIHYGEASSEKAPARFYVELHRARLQYWQKHHGTAARTCVWAISLFHQTVRLAAGGITCLVHRHNKTARIRSLERHTRCISWLLLDGLSRNLSGRQQ